MISERGTFEMSTQDTHQFAIVLPQYQTNKYLPLKLNIYQSGIRSWLRLQGWNERRRRRWSLEEKSSQLAPCCRQSGAGGLPEDGQLGQPALELALEPALGLALDVAVAGTVAKMVDVLLFQK